MRFRGMGFSFCQNNTLTPTPTRSPPRTQGCPRWVGVGITVARVKRTCAPRSIPKVPCSREATPWSGTCQLLAARRLGARQVRCGHALRSLRRCFLSSTRKGGPMPKPADLPPAVREALVAWPTPNPCAEARCRFASSNATSPAALVPRTPTPAGGRTQASSARWRARHVPGWCRLPGRCVAPAGRSRSTVPQGRRCLLPGVRAMGRCPVGSARGGLRRGGGQERGLKGAFEAEVTAEVEPLVGQGAARTLEFEAIETAARTSGAPGRGVRGAVLSQRRHVRPRGTDPSVPLRKGAGTRAVVPRPSRRRWAR